MENALRGGFDFLAPGMGAAGARPNMVGRRSLDATSGNLVSVTWHARAKTPRRIDGGRVDGDLLSG